MEEVEQSDDRESPDYYFQYLPQEITAHIMSYLPTIEDRKAASMVCRSWRDAYHSPSIRKKELLVITSPEIVDELYSIADNNRVFPNVSIRGIDINRTRRRFWRRFSPYMRNLTISSCEIREKSFMRLIKRCGELESLSIHDCRDLFLSGELFQRPTEREMLEIVLGRVKSLSLGYNRYLSDCLFVRFTSICQNLQELSLPGCYISFHSGVYHRFYQNGHNEPSDSVLTFNVIHSYIKENAPRLKSLSFAETLIDGDSLSSLAQTPELAIEKMYLRGCVQVTNDSLMTLSEYQNYLTDLDLALCPRITDISLTTICNRLTGLKFLSVQGCRNITDSSASELWRLIEIVRLNISECERIKDSGILKGLATRQNDTLKELFMSHLTQITEKPIMEIMVRLPNLTHLDLSYCSKAVTDKAVQTICLHGKRLKTLILTKCENLTDKGITGMTTELPSDPDSKEARLRHFMETRDDFCLAADDPDREEIEKLLADIPPESELKGGSLKHLKNLKNLTLSGCKKITDMSLKYGLKVEDLKSLDLSSCPGITAEGLSHIGQQNKSLEVLNLDNCNNIDDQGAGHIFKNLRRLKSLSLGSNKITNHILDFLGVRTSSLSYLDVRHCKHLTAATVNKIIAYYPGLQVVHFSTKDSDFQYTAPHPPPPSSSDSP